MSNLLLIPSFLPPISRKAGLKPADFKAPLGGLGVRKQGDIRELNQINNLLR